MIDEKGPGVLLLPDFRDHLREYGMKGNCKDIRKVLAWAMAFLLLAGSGCATRLKSPAPADMAVEAERREQLKFALSLLLERQARASVVANKLLRANAQLCGDDIRYTFGFFAIDSGTFKPEYREVATDIGLEQGVRVWKVLPGLEAAASGLKKGDRIVEVNGKAVSDFESFTIAMKEPWETGRLSMKVARNDDEVVSVSLKGRPACDYRIAVIERDVVNAFADGKNVFVTTGMLRFLESDDELAIVLGHEFAHNALRHLRQMQAQSFAGMLVDLAILVFGGVDTRGLFSQLGRLVYSKEFESDADYMGLYFAARAGYQVEAAPLLWRRMAAEHPGGIKDTTWLASHPSTPERAVSLKRTIEAPDDTPATPRPVSDDPHLPG
ncbi:MAG: M48 family metalloprotease [Deltaproteobacteria bacterium]|nr:M48 family metalloprotease [Deltaproteobacteria bacterium]